MRSTQDSGQILRSKKRPRRTLRSGRGSRTNSNTSRQIPARVIDAAYDTLPAAGFCAEMRAQPLIAPLAADLYLRKRSVFGRPPRILAKFSLGIDRRPTHNSPMNKLYYERADYSVVVKNRAPPPKAWRWEIYRAGNVNPIKQSSVYFDTTAAARGAGKEALKDLLNKLFA